MGEIESTLTRDQEFPADRWFAIVKRHAQAGAGGHFRRPEARRATADDGEMRVGVQEAEMIWLDDSSYVVPKAPGRLALINLKAYYRHQGRLARHLSIAFEAVLPSPF